MNYSPSKEVAVCIVTVALNLLTDGVPLLGTPKVENIDRVVVTHTDYPDDVKEITDEYYIELAESDPNGKENSI